MRPRPLATSAQPQIDIRVAMALMTGDDWSFLSPIGRYDRDPMPEPVLQAAWGVILEPLTLFFSLTFPAQRPVAWWSYTAPQARRHVKHHGVYVEPWNQPSQQHEEEPDDDLECSCRYLKRLKLLHPHELTRVQVPDWPGCEEENPDAWRQRVITCEDLGDWLEREGYAPSE